MTSGYSIFLVRIDFIDLYVQWKISFSEKRDIIQTGTFYVIDSNKVGLHFLSEGENLGNTFIAFCKAKNDASYIVLFTVSQCISRVGARREINFMAPNFSLLLQFLRKVYC